MTRAAIDKREMLFGGYMLVREAEGIHKGYWFLENPAGDVIAKFWGGAGPSEASTMMFLDAFHRFAAPKLVDDPVSVFFKKRAL
jgi:hypothetical protein